MTDQIFIKVLLIAVAIVFAFVLMRRGASARNQALRTIALLLFLTLAIIAVIFPSIVNDLALAVGVGRGADLLLYAFLIVFVGNSISSARRGRERDAQITELARHIAIANPRPPHPAMPSDQ